MNKTGWGYFLIIGAILLMGKSPFFIILGVVGLFLILLDKKYFRPELRVKLLCKMGFSIGAGMIGGLLILYYTQPERIEADEWYLAIGAALTVLILSAFGFGQSREKKDITIMKKEKIKTKKVIVKKEVVKQKNRKKR